MIYISFTNFVLISQLGKDHSMTEPRCLKNVFFFQTITSFVQSKKIINIYNDLARNIELLQLKTFENMKNLSSNKIN